MGVAPWLKVYSADEMCSGRFFISVILLVDGLHELYAGTAGGGQVRGQVKVFVRGYEHLEPSRLSSCDELAILQTGPATLVGCFHDVARKRVTQWGWRTLIK